VRQRRKPNWKPCQTCWKLTEQSILLHTFRLGFYKKNLKPEKLHFKLTYVHCYSFKTDMGINVAYTGLLHVYRPIIEVERFTIRIGFYTFQQRRIADNKSLISYMRWQTHTARLNVCFNNKHMNVWPCILASIYICDEWRGNLLFCLHHCQRVHALKDNVLRAHSDGEFERRHARSMTSRVYSLGSQSSDCADDDIASDLSGFRDKSFSVNHQWTDLKQSADVQRWESTLVLEW